MMAHAITEALWGAFSAFALFCMYCMYYVRETFVHRWDKMNLCPHYHSKSNALVYTSTLMRYIPWRYKSLSIRDTNLFSTMKYDDISCQISKYFQLWLVHMLCCELSYDIDNLCILTYYSYSFDLTRALCPDVLLNKFFLYFLMHTI